MQRLLLLGLALCPLVNPAAAEGLFGGGNRLDPSFCKPHNIRQTVIYVDDSIIATGDTGWARTIYDKLRSTLVPGEPTALVELSPMNGQSTQLWSGCWPDYTTLERAKIRASSHLFSADPLAQVRDQQGFFARDLGVAEEKIIVKAGRPASQITIDPANPPQKSVLRALASDGARYAHADNTIRAILYSDFAENSDLGSVFKKTPEVDYGDKLGTYLRHSVFYVFGIASDVKGSGAIQDSIHSFWDPALRSMGANIGGLGSDLTVPNVVPVTSRSYNLLLRDSSQTLAGRLSILFDPDGTLVDSWIGILRLRNASINGSFHCAAVNDGPPCALEATTAGGVVTTSPSEAITLTSQDNDTLTGSIGVPGSHVNLPLAATPSPN